MDIMTAHMLLTMLELLDDGWQLNDYIIKEDDRIGVELIKVNTDKANEFKTIYFERRVK